MSLPRRAAVISMRARGADIDECASGPCQNQGTCLNLVNGWSCTCGPGYTGLRCQTNINECASNPCQNGASCADASNGYTCQCAAGYSGLRCETDVNECAS